MLFTIAWTQLPSNASDGNVAVWAVGCGGGCEADDRLGLEHGTCHQHVGRLGRCMYCVCCVYDVCVVCAVYTVNGVGTVYIMCAFCTVCIVCTECYVHCDWYDLCVLCVRFVLCALLAYVPAAKCCAVIPAFG